MKKQQGFTLIELMIVVAIVGILAAIAIPAYQDYIKRSKVSEIAATMGACKTSVTEFFQANNALPADANAAGCDTTANQSQYVAALAVANGVINATGSATLLGTGANGIQLSMMPCSNPDGGTIAGTCTTTVAGTSIAAWECSTVATDDYKYAPANCRQAASGGT